MLRLLSVEHLRMFAEVLHQHSGEWFPDPRPLPDDCWGCLGSILQAVQVPMFGKVRYPDPWQRATALLVRISRRHCLPNGNKRLAAGAFLVTIRVNLETFYPGRAEKDAVMRWLHGEQSAIKALAVVAARTRSEQEDELIADVTPAARRAMTLDPPPEDGSSQGAGGSRE